MQKRVNLSFFRVNEATIPYKNNETYDKFYRKVAFLMYAEMVNFRPSKQKPHPGLGTRLPSS